MSGLRERKKLATRTALADAALRLCVERGLDGVTVEQVANEAGVSLRTFFNYFSSKEEAVVAGDVATAAAFVRVFAGRPGEEPVLRALRAALVEVVPDRIDPDRVALLRVLRRTPALLPHQIAAFAAQERELAAAVAARVGVDPATDLYPAMFAATVMATLRVVVGWWLDAVQRPELSDLIGVMIERLETGFAVVGPDRV
ncbi:TetR/AcrR family transcriptional regulator [Saccharothrix sp. HUAS TT1]|uniref:TetR/AcrR family transcriptional regulator n=1 Tax=unclassified Saccharothrix TaxID=2593673 RepID=UPI00345B9321